MFWTCTLHYRTKHKLSIVTQETHWGVWRKVNSSKQLWQTSTTDDRGDFTVKYEQIEYKHTHNRTT